MAPLNVRDGDGGGGIAKLPLLSPSFVPSRVTRATSWSLVNCVSKREISGEKSVKTSGNGNVIAVFGKSCTAVVQ